MKEAMRLVENPVDRRHRPDQAVGAAAETVGLDVGLLGDAYHVADADVGRGAGEPHTAAAPARWFR
jgi:hypothetical protein